MIVIKIMFKFIIFITFGAFFSDGARILTVVPTPSISHQVVFRPLTQELARRGHNVTIITTDPAFPKGQTPENLKEIDIHDFSYKAWREMFMTTKTSGNAADTLEQMTTLLRNSSHIFEMQMNLENVQSVINNSTNQYDLLILESCAITAMGLSHIFKVPVISMSSFGGLLDHYDVIGAPNRPTLLYPTIFRQRLVNLTLWEKVSELFMHYVFCYIVSSTIDENNAIVKRLFGQDAPTIAELNKNIDLLFLNLHPIWEFNRPVPPNAIYLGGLHQKPTNELPNDLKTFLDSSKNGVIYISYGTNVSPSLLPPEKIQILVEVFSELPYDVLWKWDEDELPNRSSNIKISKWLPQSDLLKHPKIKLFITQGGLQSTDEAITAGVPLIGMPMLGDQWYNVEMYVYHKIGVRLDMTDVTKKTFKDAVITVIKDPSFRKNIENLRNIMNDQPQKPLECAVWWTEYLLRHGGASHLKALTANMSWSEYLDLELFSALALIALSAVIAVACVIRWVYLLVKHNLFKTKLKQN